MPALHFADGEKGGVGKSFFARILAQYHLDKEIEFTAFDTDRSNPDLKRIYGKIINCQLAIFSEGEKYEDTANQLFNAALKKTTICNLPAQVFPAFKEWIETNELIDVAEDAGVTFYKWFVSDCGSDSLKLFKRSLLTFGKSMPHIFVKNMGMTEDWEPFDDDEEIQKLIKQYNVKVMSFPKFLGNKARNLIDNKNMTFDEAKVYEGFDVIQKSRIKSFLRKAYQELEMVDYL